jgi:hypothetical protein
MTVPTSLPATGTYTFSPSAGDLVHYAFSLCNLRRTDLNTAHYADAEMAANLAMVELSNSNPLRFARETIAIPLTAGNATYSLPNRVLAVFITTIATGSGPTLTERVLGPISDYQYEAMPTKAQAAPPSSYFFSLLSTPTVTFWPTPDSGGPYTANVSVFRQMQDVDLTNAQGIDSPYRFLDAYITNVAARLADSYAPAKADGLYARAAQRLTLAQGRDQESTPISIIPALGSYYRIN